MQWIGKYPLRLPDGVVLALDDDVPEDLAGNGSFVFGNFLNLQFETAEEYAVYLAEKARLMAAGNNLAHTYEALEAAKELKGPQQQPQSEPQQESQENGE